MQSKPENFASPEEVALAFAALGAADFARLGRIAQIRSRGLPETDWQDLLHESVVRTLNGARTWPTDVPFMAFLAQTIRSVASETWRRRAAAPRVDLPRDAPASSDPLANVVDESPDPERAAIYKDLSQRFRGMLADDKLALAVLDGLMHGLSPQEIQISASMTSTEYDSTRRRIRRLIARSIPELI